MIGVHREEKKTTFALAFACSIVCLVTIVVTLIWKKSIEVELIEEEKLLIRQLNSDTFRPIWAPTPLLRASPPQDDEQDSLPPPPYNGSGSAFRK